MPHETISEQTRITVRERSGGAGPSHVTVSITSLPRATSHPRSALHLPPIVIGENTAGSDIPTPSQSSPRTPEVPVRGQSRYHRGCCIRPTDAKINRPARRSQCVGKIENHGRRAAALLDEASVTLFLEERRDFLDQYVLKRVTLDVLERWTALKTCKESSMKRKETEEETTATINQHGAMQSMIESLAQQPTNKTVALELARRVTAACGVTGCVIYSLDRSDPDTVLLYCGEHEEPEPMTAHDRPLIMRVSQLCSPLRLCCSRDRRNYPHPLCTYPEAEHIMYVPIAEAEVEGTAGGTVVVLELWRIAGEASFTRQDEDACGTYAAWGGLALRYARLRSDVDRQQEQSGFLVHVVRSIFQDIISMDAVVRKVMNFAQKLVNADRASLFLVDPDTHELYATVFDVGVEENSAITTTGSEASAPKSTAKEIRFPIGTGIAGHVALTGDVLNIKDAYEDDRFNRTVDDLTGYKTKTILCMPIYNRSAIIGVVQMVNKKSGVFTIGDEKAFETFAGYCGLALHQAILYERIRRSQHKYRVALDVLSYHSTCTEEEVSKLNSLEVSSADAGLDDFYFSPFDYAEFEKAAHAIFMFYDLFPKLNLDRTRLVKFVLTVKKNYRRVPYHNWTHGFAVANCMYNILRDSDVFANIERLALFIGALCHDLDHRGKNNKFMLETDSPLAAMYSTSTLEHHHFNQTVTILQQDGHNILSNLSSSEYKQFLSLLKQCILATDLAAFFPNRAKLAQLVNDSQFDWRKTDHRKLVLAMSMTAADLSASAKPWTVQVETVKVIFQEFYEQGDAERARGKTSLSMMDRTKPEEQANSQVGFLSSICLPCYGLITGLLPHTVPLLRMCEENLARWQQVERQVKAELAAGRLPTHLYIATEPDSHRHGKLDATVSQS